MRSRRVLLIPSRLLRRRYDSLISALQGFLDVVTKNRAQLFPQTEAAEEAAASAGQAAESAEEPQITNISASDEDAQEE